MRCVVPSVPEERNESPKLIFLTPIFLTPILSVKLSPSSILVLSNRSELGPHDDEMVDG